MATGEEKPMLEQETPGETGKTTKCPEPKFVSARNAKIACAVCNWLALAAVVILILFGAFTTGTWIWSNTGYALDVTSSLRVGVTAVKAYVSGKSFPNAVLSSSYGISPPGPVWGTTLYYVSIAAFFAVLIYAVGLTVDALLSMNMNMSGYFNIGYEISVGQNWFRHLYAAIVEIILWQVFAIMMGVTDIFFIIAISTLSVAWNILLWASSAINDDRNYVRFKAQTDDPKKVKPRAYIFFFLYALLIGLTTFVLLWVTFAYMFGTGVALPLASWILAIGGIILYLLYLLLLCLCDLRILPGHKDRNMKEITHTCTHGLFVLFVVLVVVIGGFADVRSGNQTPLLP